MSKRKLMVVLTISNIVLILLCIVLIMNLFSCRSSKKDEDSTSKVTKIDTFKNVETFRTSSGSTIILEDSKYAIRPGYTYYLDKGNMKLFADITPADEGKVLHVTGKEYHMDNEMTDAAINDTFTLDLNTGEYTNTSEDMIVTYDGLTATFKDNRSHIALKFTGTLDLVQSIIAEGTSAYEDQIDPRDIVSVSIATEVPDEQLSADDLANIPNDSTDLGDSEFAQKLIPANERQTMTITAKFIESTSNSGSKYQEVSSGIYFYAFGQSCPYASGEIVTVNAVYRGNEQHFNGLQMDNKYPCFVINSISK